MLTPAKLKHRKCFKGKIHGNAYAGTNKVKCGSECFLI